MMRLFAMTVGATVVGAWVGCGELPQAETSNTAMIINTTSKVILEFIILIPLYKRFDLSSGLQTKSSHNFFRSSSSTFYPFLFVSFDSFTYHRMCSRAASSFAAHPRRLRPRQVLHELVKKFALLRTILG
jgi:hypothetical protein